MLDRIRYGVESVVPSTFVPRVCGIDGCDRTATVRFGLCGKHVNQYHCAELRGMSVRDRFWLYVQPPSIHDCWEWYGTRQKRYGTLGVTGTQKNVLAHRAAYELFKGTIPDGLVIDHLCHNIFCVNPLHLEAVTQKVNMQRSRPAMSATCKRGHDLTDPDNLVSSSLPRRDCRTCAKVRRAEKVLVESGTG